MGKQILNIWKKGGKIISSLINHLRKMIKMMLKLIKIKKLIKEIKLIVCLK